jgi:hypothetical protein
VNSSGINPLTVLLVFIQTSSSNHNFAITI